MSYRYTRIYLFWCGKGGKKGYVYQHAHAPSGVSWLDIDWVSVARWLRDLYASVSEVSWSGFQVVHSFSDPAADWKSISVDSPRRSVATLMFQRQDLEFRSIVIPSVPKPTNWKFTTEFDALAAALLTHNIGWIDPNGAEYVGQSYVGAYSGIDFSERVERTWKQAAG